MDRARLSEIWSNVQLLMSASGLHYGEAVQHAIKDSGLEGLRLGLLIHAFQFEPEPITADRLQRNVPYYATAPFEDGFQKLAEHGFLEGSTGSFILTKKGHQALTTVFDAALHQLTIVEKSLPSALLRAVRDMLKRLNEAAAASQEITEKQCFKMQVRTMPSKATSILSDIEDLVSNLYSFRCDAHRHAWQQLDYDLDGPTWEAITAIWQGDGDSVATIAENRLNARPTRGFTEEVYAKSVETLVEYGWIEVFDAKNDIYRMTDLGNKIRQDAEDETDRIFYGIWSTLSESEIERLNSLTLQLVELLSQPVVEHK